MTATIIGIIVGIFTFLVGLLKIVTSQRNSAREERDQAIKNHAIVKNRAEKGDVIAEKQHQVQKESAAHEQTIKEYSGDPPTDTEYFGDSRLRREDDRK